MNLQDFENQGWTQMREMLNREMPTQTPQKRKKRFVIWWQFAGLALFGVFAFSFAWKMFFTNHQNLIEKKYLTNDKIANIKNTLSTNENADNQVVTRKSVLKQEGTEGVIFSSKNNFDITKKHIVKDLSKGTEGVVFSSKNNFDITKKSFEIEDSESLTNKEANKEKNKITEHIDSQLVNFLPLISKEIKMEKSKLNITFASPLQPLETAKSKLPLTKWAVFAASNASLFSPFNAALGVQYRLPLRAKNWDFWAGVSCWATSKTAESWVYLHPSEIEVAASSTTTASITPLMPLEELQLTHLFYVNIPLNAQYNFSNTFLKKMYIDLNFNASYLFSQRLENKETGIAKYALSTQGSSRTLADPLSNMSNNTQVLPRNFVAQDLGLNTWDFSAGVGVGYRLGADWSASVQYQQGLHSILTTSFSTHYTHFWQLKMKKEF